MIENKVAFLADADNPFALGGLIGGLFFAGYMLTQFPGGYLGDKYGHRTIISLSLIWAGIATLLQRRARRASSSSSPSACSPGLGEGAFYSNDRSLIAEDTPSEKRCLGMGVVITGLALGITIATVFAPNLIELGGKVFAARRRVADAVPRARRRHAGGRASASRPTSAARSPGCRTGARLLHMLAYAAVGLAAVMAVYFIGDAAGLCDLLDRGARGRRSRSRWSASCSRAAASDARRRCCALATSC